MVKSTIDGIAYAGDRNPEMKVCGVRPMAGYRLWLRFSTGEARVFAFSQLLGKAAFNPLGDESVFNSVYLDYGVPTWNNGEIDISPAYLYENSVSTDIASA